MVGCAVSLTHDLVRKVADFSDKIMRKIKGNREHFGST
jgi:hypothetical protein